MILSPKTSFFINYFLKRDNIYGDYVKIMKTITVVAIVIVVGVFIGIIATADYGDFVKERELRNLELSYYELQQKIKQCEELSGYSQETCYIELKRFEESHEKMIVRYEGFTGLEVYHMAKDGKNSLLQSNEFWDTYEEQLQNCRETWIGNEEQLNSCITQVHVDLDIEN